MRFWGKGLALLMLLCLPSAEVQADHKGLDYPHNSATGTGCNSCHYIQGGEIPSWATQDLNDEDLDNTRYNNSCWECHDTYTAPYMVTHSNQSEDAVAKYGAKWSIECRTCHWPHHQKQLRTYGAASYLISGVSTEVTTYTLRSAGAEWQTNKFVGNVLIPDTTTASNKYTYQYKILSNTSDTITVKSAIDTIVRVATQNFAVIYGKLIKSTISTPNSGNKTVRFFRSSGTKSFADGGSTRDGICEVCHTKTTHYRNDGSGVDQDHDNIGGKNGTDCMACHPHASGMKHGLGSGAGCGDASSCHGLRQSHPAHVAAGGNVGRDCSTCHDTNNFPSFKRGSDTNDNGIIDLAETDVCYDCHHDGTYVATGAKVNASLPAWEDGNIGCDGCHANGPAYPNGSPKANSHAIHGSFTCNKCHNATTGNGTTINNKNKHCNNAYNLNPGSGVNFNYSFAASGGTCANISCHGNTNASWGHTACLGCHNASQGNRAAIAPQFSANSHHVQGVTVTDLHCYKCHWEANADGSINSTYHGGYFNADQPVNLVIYGAGARPTTYYESSSGLSYTPDGSRSEIAKLNSHCMSCHSDPNNDTEPFGDCNTPRQYAWDTNSIKARYSQANTTTWGKYSTTIYPNVAAKNITKAYSAHGNAISNQGGWSPTTGLDDSITSTRAGYQNVLCFDCHNSHGSSASGTTSSYKTFDGSQNGAILKNTAALKGGYFMDYVPTGNADASDNNPYATGADLCFDCHLTQYAVETPWGYGQTFGAASAIQGYKDGARFGTSVSGTKQRFSYKVGRSNMGGHLKASDTLKGLNGVYNGNEALFQIGGLCTPCHDPHGVSPSLGAGQAYGVPLLKGTWLTSPYKEDSPEMTGTPSGYYWAEGVADSRNERHYNTDRVTFKTTPETVNGSQVRIHYVGGQITEDDTLFAGLCLSCHPKTNLTDGVNGTGATGWKGVDRIHETVKGWGSNGEHTFPCSKCHVPHNSGLPRLMQTNCLNYNHRQQKVSGGLPSSYTDQGRWGRFPGKSDHNYLATLDGCHEVSGASGSSAWPNNQFWNNVTLW